MITRLEVAEYVADRLQDGRRDAIRRVAAWLIAKGRVRDARYLINDVATIQAQRGYVYVKATSARPLSPAAERSVTEYAKTAFAAREIELNRLVDERVIGGVRLESPTDLLDTTVSRRLNRLSEEGVSL